jgi:LuxR family maltose regulon positive regulatory protein
LIERLGAGIRSGCKLTLISAPAGFGKTTLASTWVQQSKSHARIAWVSLEEQDNDLARFLAYLVAALQTVSANIGGSLTLLQSPQSPPIESILTALINEIAEITDNVILVLDDYHAIESQPIDNALAFLLDHLPPNTHLIISSRTDPSLPLSRLRARGQMVEIRANDLRFTVDEIAVFLNEIMGLNLSPEEVAALEARTEGWIAGLQLAALSVQRLERSDDIAGSIKSFTGSNRYIMDYLVQEVFEQQTESVQSFLLQTAILDRLTGPLCDALTGQGTGQVTLEMLERANLFLVPLDAEWRWYRYHHLFANLLRQRLRRTQPERIGALHHRASEWYEDNALVDDAVKHALAAQDFGRAARLIEKLAKVLWERGEPTTLLRWLEGLPDRELSSRPSLCNFNAWALFMNGQNEAAERWLQVAERALDSAVNGPMETASQGPDQPHQLDIMEQRGRAAAIRASIAFRQGDAPGIFRFSHQALEYLPEKSLMWRCMTAMALGMAQDLSGDTQAASRTLLEAVAMSKASGNIYLILSTSLYLGTILMSQGRLRQVHELCRELLRLAGERGVLRTEMAGCLYDELGFVLCEWNDLDEAMRHLEIGSRLSKRGYDVGVLGWSYLTMLKARFTQGDIAGAQGVIQEMDNMERESDVPPWYTSPKEAWKARLWLAQGDLDTASRWVQDRGLSADGVLDYSREDENVVLARILLAQGRWEEALGLLERLLEVAEKSGRTARVIEILILQALARDAQGDTIQALIVLERALSLARPGGYVRIFVDEGPPMAKLLRQAASHGISLDYVGKLLAALGSSDDQEPPDLAQPLIEPLTKRELEILRLFRTELSGPEIADELVVALSTVRYHTKNIYGKLGVNHRRAAVQRAQELNLLWPTGIHSAPPGSTYHRQPGGAFFVSPILCSHIPPHWLV